MSEITNLPPLLLPFSRKNKKWRKLVVDWADSKTFFNYSLVRKSVIHKKINYDLLNGKLHMSDLAMVLNPSNVNASFIPDSILHYPIMNSKLNVLRGEESKRIFDYRVIITNPNAVSEIEENKKQQLVSQVLLLIQDLNLSEEQFNAEMEKLSDFFTFKWLDMREVRANALLNHYSKELNILLLFNLGFVDALAVGEEIYKCDIIGGEPVIEKLNPLKVRIFKSGYSNKIEDADIVVIEDYWSPGRVIDTFYDVLTKKDMEYIESMPNSTDHTTDSMDNIDDRFGYVNALMVGEQFTSLEGFFWDPIGGTDGIGTSLLPFDTAGNIRVLQVYWKSRRRIKRVKSYDPITGEEIFTLYPETYIINKDLGEEEKIFYVNEAWEGTKIGQDIYVNMRPRVIQYNRLSNPSRCHFGIIGSIYNLNDNKPFSMVDMMKPYNYLYDTIHDRLNKLIARNWGMLVNLDLAKVPKGWDIDKWMYFAKTNGIIVTDSFKEGNIGAATGKIAGAFNSQTVINAELGNTILLYTNLLEFIKMEMSDVAGISKQREGLISNRETVGGVERATLQSSYITEWLFTVHDDVKKRVLEAFIETAKIAIKGRSLKFLYILSDNSYKVMDIDGDEFAECDYGLVVDNSNGTLQLQLKLDMLAQAALLNQALTFSTIMKLYNSSSLAEKQRMVEENEQQMIQRQQEALQLLMQQLQQQLQAQAQMKQTEMELLDSLNQRDNETKILVATINAQSLNDGIKELIASEESKANLMEKMREFDERLKLDRDRLEFDKKKAETDASIKRLSIKTKTNNKQ